MICEAWNFNPRATEFNPQAPEPLGGHDLQTKLEVRALRARVAAATDLFLAQGHASGLAGHRSRPGPCHGLALSS